MNENNLTAKQDTAKVRVSYDVTQAVFASQFIVTSNEDEIIINFSSGHISDPTTGDAILPINCRIAVSQGGARRLVGTLNQALEKHKPGGAEARFPQPRVSVDN